MNLILALIIGGIIGWLASIVMRTDAQQGIFMNIIVGIVGSLLGSFLLGGLFGVALLALRRAGRRTAVPFGPWMLAGAWLGILAGAPLAEAYLSLFGLGE